MFSSLNLQFCQRATDEGLAMIFAKRESIPSLEINLKYNNVLRIC